MTLFLFFYVCKNRYVADISRQRAESMLKNEDKEGCFVVRNSSTPGLYTLSLYTKLPHPQVRPIFNEYLQRKMRKFYYIQEVSKTMIKNTISFFIRLSTTISSKILKAVSFCQRSIVVRQYQSSSNTILTTVRICNVHF